MVKSPAAMSTAPVIIRTRPLWKHVLGYTAFALLGGGCAALIFEGHEVPRAVPVVAGAVALAALGLAVSRSWNDRVEFHPDHLLERRIGRSRRIAIDDIAHMTLRYYDPRRGLDDEQALHLALFPREGRPIRFTGSVAGVMPAVKATYEPMVASMSARMEAGEVLTFADGSILPGLRTLAVAFGLTCVALLLAVLGLGAADWTERAELLLGLGATIATLFTMLRRWRQTLRNRGLLVSAQGIRPLVRGGRSAEAPWTPWPQVVGYVFDGLGLTIRTAAPDGVIALSTSTHNAYPLYRLLIEWNARARRAPPDHRET